MLRLTACAAAFLALCATGRAAEPPHSAELDDMIVRQAKRHGVPEKLVRRIVMRESKYNPLARNHKYWGLMQISYPTAKSMGFRGTPTQLLDPLVNLTYAVPYLANAFIIAGKQEDAAVRLYASGYYATAKNRNLLGELRTAESDPVAPDTSFIAATTRPVSNLFSAVVSGPPPQQVAAVDPVTNAPPALPGGVPGARDVGAKDGEPEVMMTGGKKGNEPPKKWVRDGGVTVIARGEQRVDQVAAYTPPADSDAKPAHRAAASRGKTRKTTEFASLDAPPANAQAYASGPDARGPQSGPQAAIAQATAQLVQAAAPTDAPVQAAGVAQADATPVEPSDDFKPARVKGHARKVVARKIEDTEAGSSTANADGDAQPVSAHKKTVAKPKQVAGAPKKAGAKAVAVASKSDEPSAAPATKWRDFQ